jgi:ABC-2 type transport system permease protein
MSAMPAKRVFLWAIRREVWENRSIYIVPLTVAAIALFGFFISTFRLARKVRGMASMTVEQQINTISSPFAMSSSVILASGVLVALFYSLDALYGERRDRSILFWKSMPVSDLTTVLSKAAIPTIVQPLVAMALALAVQAVMFVLTNLVLIGSGVGPAALWTRLPFVQMPFVMAYGVAVHALWLAPLYAWLLLVSAWARRTPILWAVVPFFAVYVLERVLWGKSYVVALLRYRFMGAMSLAFTVKPPSHVPIVRFSQLDPLRFLTSPGLWLGLLAAALFLVLAARLRRNQEPI